MTGAPPSWEQRLRDGSYADALRTLAVGARIDLRGANLQGLDLSAPGPFPWDLTDADLRGARLHLPHLVTCRLERTRLEVADAKLEMIRALWSGQVPRNLALFGADLSGIDLHGAELRKADLAACNLEGANLEGANLVAPVLRQARLRGARLAGARGNRWKLDHADLGDADLRGVEVELVFADHVTARGADFGRARLTTLTATDADFSDSDWRDATVVGGVLQRCLFVGARVDGLTLEDVVLENTAVR